MTTLCNTGAEEPITSCRSPLPCSRPYSMPCIISSLLPQGPDSSFSSPPHPAASGDSPFPYAVEDKAERVWQRATEVKDPIPGAMLLYARYLACKKSDFAAAEALVARARLHHPSDEEALKAEGELERLVEDIEGEGEAAKEARVSAAVASALTSFEVMMLPSKAPCRHHHVDCFHLSCHPRPSNHINVSLIF